MGHQTTTALSYVGKEDGDLAYDATIKGSVYSCEPCVFLYVGRFAWSIDVDYRMGNFKEVEENGVTTDIDPDLSFNNLTLGVGLRYNF